MWNCVNTMGHPGHLMGPQMNQKRKFSLNFQNVPIVPGKNFTNPNFVNKHHASVHNYENNIISTPLEQISHIDSSDVNKSKSLNTNCGLINSSRSIIDAIKENQLDIVKRIEPNSEVVQPTNTKPVQMCYNTKRNRRSRNRRRNKKNTNRQQVRDMMDVDVEMEPAINASDVSMSPKLPNNTFNLAEFIIERPNKPSELKEDRAQCESDEEDVVTVMCISPTISRTSIRERQLSLADSEDSFIVFESGTDEELEFSEEESEDECDEEEDVDSASPVIPQKRVRFADDGNLCEIHPMVQWSYAYQEARKGHWQVYARDRDRFQRRVDNLKEILSPVLDSKHRDAVYRERFS